MPNDDFLLEIGVEEMPARFVDQARKQLLERTEDWLKKQRISYADIQSFATPRRLAVLVEQLAHKQEDTAEEAKGPAQKIAVDEQGNWTKAALGFAKSQGIDPNQLILKSVKGQEYIFAQKFQAGQQTIQLLPQIKEVITAMTFPKKMRWGANDFAFVRPISWIVALFGSEVIPFEITGVHTGKQSRGHRVLGQTIDIEQPSYYEKMLLEEYVIANVSDRKESIVNQLKQLEQKNDWHIPIDEQLLNEVTHLVEYPTAISGSFDEQFLQLPSNVLITSMKEHQRYFPVQDDQGNLLPYFVTLRNGQEDEAGIVSKGNEKVLRARLADAQFFFEEDQKLKISRALSQLENVVFHEELGSIGDKVRRVRQLATNLAQQLGIDESGLAKVDRAATICKFDLITNMVDEFPKLQGKMGEIYARKAGEDEEVACAISDHYLPRFAHDRLPQTEIGAIISIADKLDTIIACFSLDLKPSGSQDPYALRRQAAGVIRIIAEKKWPFNLSKLIDMTIQVLSHRQLMKRTEDETSQELIPFFTLRMKQLLQEKQVRYDVIDAVLEVEQGDVVAVFAKADILMIKMKHTDDFKSFIEACTRVHNLAQKLNRDIEHIDVHFFEHEAEHALLETFEKVHTQFHQAVKASDWESAFESLRGLIKPIEHYFEHVMIMAESDDVRYNRLALLRKITQLNAQFADFSQMVLASKS